ncbi:MAG: nucleotide exchange factor GrpE [Candidatus Ryanbacteria bacterium RIFCSPHIGHO2_01_FULL_48_27]|uniref:Protein GrpE n=1 Tax=Candidatus Ryanbacteria bacterium RIFCSPHIGHO2_01_FULL_48_27 TaxID=1802115 RepID=A0A1G2G1T1_9BACT|nr:MAG: nucleotide exchange factor GrpE [Candidatus Ryanbacteria bacterium RIFCSPHIGHO2_01_FULL_48_27]
MMHIMPKKQHPRDKTEITPEDHEALGRADDSFADAVREKVQKLTDDLQICHKEREEYLDGWQRARAEFANARSQEAKSREEFVKFAEEHLLSDLLEVANNFDRAFAGTEAENPYVKGFSYIRDQFMRVLADHGVTPIPALGQAFDASLHDAIEQREMPDAAADGIIVQELERGYLLHGKAIKASKVAVGIYKPANR